MNDPKNLLHVRDWNMISYHRPFSVSCFEPDGLNKYHYVFTIPKNLLRDRPIRFNQFKLTDEAQEVQKCFLFFLDFIHEMVCKKIKKDSLEPGRNSVAFVEWCPRSDAKTVRDIAGWRIHVFVDRDEKELDVLKQYINGFEKKAKKCLQKRLSVPEHFEITSLTRYANDIYAAYSSEECNVQDLYDNIQNGSNALPSALFKAKELRDSMYTLEDYENIDGSFTFPGTEFVRVDPEELSVEKFFKKQLPDYVLFNLVKPEVRVYRDEQRVEFLPHRNYENIDLDFAALDDFLRLRQNDFVIYEAGRDIDLYNIGELTCSKGLHQGDLWMNRVNFHNLEGKAASVYEECRRNQAELSIIDCIKISSYSQSESERAKYLEEEFLTHVWNDEDCKESEPLKAVIRWFQKEYDHTMLPDPQLLCHRGMSVMGHRATLLMEMKTLLFQVASAHRASYYLEIARLDAFRHEHNMHLNAVFTGDAATSKSFTLKQLIENSIGNTMSMRTYDTDKADAVDSDKDHWVSMFDEAPAGMFHDPKKRGPVEALKMRTTEMKTSHRRLFTDEEGTRLQIESTSSNIGCMFGATNESRSKFDAALQERFHFFEAEKCLTTTRSTEDCQHAAKTMIKENTLEKERWVMFLKFEQGFAAMAWTFIRLGVIKKPDISAYMNVSRRFCTILQKQYGISIPTRTQQRMKLLCQNLAILRAKQIMYFTQTGECKNMPFHPSHLLKAEKYMICTEELAIHAIGLEFDTVVSRNERKLLKKIWEMHKENPTYKLEDKGGENDWNYLAVTGNIQSISKKLCNSLQEDHVHVSTCNIETILRDLMDRTLNSHKYKEGQDGFPASTSTMGKYIAADLDGGSLYLHVDLFKEIRQGNSEFNVYKECLAKLAHEYADEKRIILGLTPYDVDEPWRWDFYDTKRKNGKVIEFIQGNGGEIDTYGRVTANANSKITVHSDIDVYAAQQHSMTCGYEIQPYAPHDLHDWQGVNVPYPPRKNKRKR